MLFAGQKVVSAAFAVLALTALLSPPAAAAGNVEITPFAGYTWGGDVTEVRTGSTLGLRDASSYGFAIDFRQQEESWAELYLSRQQTGLQTNGGLLSGRKTLDVDIDYYHIGGTYSEATGKIKPYAVGSLGATYFNPDGEALSSDTKFSLSLGGGVKFYLTEHMGLRLEGRWFGTLVGGGGGIFCYNGACMFTVQGDVLSQFTTNAGLIFAF